MKMAILELEYKNIRKITALKLPFTTADGSVISNNFIMMANGTGKQRFTRGYKRYKETSGLTEWKIGHIFHSIFT